ncbi:MAG: flagellar filament capping protein FliD [Deltaproteobacteria bacterium]|nr:flagellar filament capping protein FliD [Deltaproteobacteria bacterium]
MADEAPFRASGLASGLDTNYIIEQLTKIESIPIGRLQQRQSAFNRQVSVLGDLTSKLQAFKTAASKLATDGGLGVKSTTENTAFSATPGTGAAAGQYDIEVTQLATAARARSGGNTKDAAMKSGTMTVSIEGTNYAIAINEGDSLATIATAIKQSGAAVTATVLNNGTQDFLSIVRKDSGFTVGTTAANALNVTLNQTGLTGENIAFTETDAVNAEFKVNGLDFERSSNTVKDAVPGTTLVLKKQGTGQETLLLENDTTQTAANLKSFVDTYNSVMGAITVNLSPSILSDRNQTLAGDGSLRSLQRSLQNIITNTVSGLGNVRTLADLGLKTNSKDGTVSIDTAKLQKALDQDSSAVNSIFSTATTGVSAVVDSLSSLYTNSADGILTKRKSSISSQLNGMGRQLESMNLRLEAFRTNLVNQFTAMEKTISGLKATGNFLSQNFK